MFDFSKLRGRIAEKGITQGDLARLLGRSEQAIYNKLRGYTYFTSAEIDKICEILDISPNEIGEYFFTRKV